MSFSAVIFHFVRAAAPPEEQQVPDGEQAAARPAGEERHAGDAGHCRQRRLLVLHPALLQAALHRGQCEFRVCPIVTRCDGTVLKRQASFKKLQRSESLSQG